MLAGTYYLDYLFTEPRRRKSCIKFLLTCTLPPCTPEESAAVANGGARTAATGGLCGRTRGASAGSTMTCTVHKTIVRLETSKELIGRRPTAAMPS